MLALSRPAYLLGILIALTFPATTEAKPKSRVFDSSPQQVFDAAYKVARTHHAISYVDQKNWLIAFHSGTSAMSWGFNCNATVEPVEGGKARLIINVQKTEKQLFAWGAGDWMADDFFKRVEQELNKEPADIAKQNGSDATPPVANAPAPQPAQSNNSAEKLRLLQAAREVLKAGLKLDSAFSVGVDRSEIQRRLVEFSAEVDDFALSEDGKQLPNFVATVRESLMSYKSALKCTTDRDQFVIEARNALSDARKDLENFEATGKEIPLKNWRFSN